MRVRSALLSSIVPLGVFLILISLRPSCLSRCTRTAIVDRCTPYAIVETESTRGDYVLFEVHDCVPPAVPYLFMNLHVSCNAMVMGIAI